MGRIDNVISKGSVIPGAVPKGSVTGQLLFIVLVNDHTQDLQLVYQMFADDIKVLGRRDYVILIQLNLAKMAECIDHNCMLSLYLHFGRNSCLACSSWTQMICQFPTHRPTAWWLSPEAWLLSLNVPSKCYPPNLDSYLFRVGLPTPWLWCSSLGPKPYSRPSQTR